MNFMNFRQNEIIFLLGAGASVDAKIPASRDMVNELERLLSNEDDWKLHKELYDFVKGAIYQGEIINGTPVDQVNYNIERLVYTLSEIVQDQMHAVYPFIQGWHPRLLQLSHTNFKNVVDLKRKIIERLKSTWLLIDNYEKLKYYQSLIDFQKQYQYPLRIFSLNYDLCIERSCGNKVRIERGFNDERSLDVRRFEDDQDQAPEIFLYKLHGSIDWKKDEHGLLTFSDEPGRGSSTDLDIIFGTNQKMQYADPYLFLMHEFRKYCLEAKLILIIGYSFGDDHINGIMAQALRLDKSRKILSIAPGNDETQMKQFISEKLKCSDKKIDGEQICVDLETAKKFMENKLSIDYFKTLFPQEDSIF